MDTPNTLPPSASDSQPPQPSKLMTKIVLGVAIVALGAAAYFLSSGGLFQGRIGDDLAADHQLEILGESIDLMDDASWPPTAGGNIAFVANDELAVNIAPEAGTVKWLKADFEYFVENGEIVVTNASTAALPEMRKICADFPGDDEGEICTNNLNEPLSHVYEEVGDYVVVFSVYDANNRKDSISKTITVDQVGGAVAGGEEEAEESFEAEVGELAPSLRTEVTELDNEYMVTVYDTSENMQNVGYTVLNCDLVRGGRSYSFYFVEEGEVIDGQRFAAPAEDIVTSGKSCYFGYEGEYTITYEYLNTEGIRFQTTTETFNFPLEDDEVAEEVEGEVLEITEEVEETPESPVPSIAPEFETVINELNVEAIVRDLDMADYPDVALWCFDFGNESSGCKNSAEIAIAGELVVMGDYEDEGPYTVTLQLLDENNVVVDQRSADITVDASSNGPLASPAGAIVEPPAPVASNPATASISVTEPINGVVVVRDTSIDTEDVVRAELDCGVAGVSSQIFSEENENLGDIASSGTTCSYRTDVAESYTIQYYLYGSDGALLGHTLEVVEIEAVFVPAAGALPVPDFTISATNRLNNNSPHQAYVQLTGLERDALSNRTPYQGTTFCFDFGDGSEPSCEGNLGANAGNLSQTHYYEGDRSYDISLKLYRDGQLINIKTKTQVFPVPSEPLAFIPNLGDYLQASVLNASQNEEVIPAGAVVWIEFACSIEPGTFTIATTGDDQKIATFNIIPADTCGARSIAESTETQTVTPTETPVQTPAQPPAQPPANPPASNGTGGSHSASEITTTCEITPENPVVGQAVSFSASDSDLEVVNGSWDFGDDKEVYKFSTKKNESIDVEHTFDKAGKYKVKLTLKNTKKTYACKKTITVDEAAARVACNDGVDNDKDGFKDLDDPGCDDENDKDEVNAIPRSGRQCNDGKDNDGDGFTDLKDIGCQNAFDNDEVNPADVILEGGDPAQQACLNKSDKGVSFADTEDSFAKDVIDNFATAFYDGGETDIKGDVIVRGYKNGSKSVFKGDQPIRRDEALKILSISSCLFEQSTAENDTQEVNYKDPEFSNKDYWARNFIYRAANQGIIKKAEFMHPGDSVTRAEFAKMLTMVDKNIRGTKIERCERDEELAGDLDFTHWGCGYFKTLDQLGIAGAIEDAKGNARLYPNEILDRTSAVIWLNNYIAVINQPVVNKPITR